MGVGGGRKGGRAIMEGAYAHEESRMYAAKRAVDASIAKGGGPNEGEKEIYQDINSLRDEIVKILHEFGATTKEEQSKSFKVNDDVAKRAYEARNTHVGGENGAEATEPDAQQPKGGVQAPQDTNVQASSATGPTEATSNGVDAAIAAQAAPDQNGKDDVGSREDRKTKHHLFEPLVKARHNWAKALCARLKQISVENHVPLAVAERSRLAGTGYGLRSIAWTAQNGSNGDASPRLDEVDATKIARNLLLPTTYLYSSANILDAYMDMRTTVMQCHHKRNGGGLDAASPLRSEHEISYYHAEQRAMAENGCSLLPKCINVQSVPDIVLDFRELQPRFGQVGVDDVSSSSAPTFTEEKLKHGQDILRRPSVLACQMFCRTGVPSEIRDRMWAGALGFTIEPISEQRKRRFKHLHEKRQMSKLLVEGLVIGDINAVLDCEHYFPFEDILRAVLAAFMLDSKAQHLCQLDDRYKPKVYGAGKSGRSHGIYPPCGVLPFRGMAWYVAPLSFLFGAQHAASYRADMVNGGASDLARRGEGNSIFTRYPKTVATGSGGEGGGTKSRRHRPLSAGDGAKHANGKRGREKDREPVDEENVKCYYLFRSMYCRYFCKLHGSPFDPACGRDPSLLGLCQTFEMLMETLQPDVNYHLSSVIGVVPLQLAFPWMVHAFANVLEPEQVMHLWDRIIGFDSLMPVCLLAVGIFRFRHMELLEARHADEVHPLLDFTELGVVPILQDVARALKETDAAVASHE